jgi:hypothetical protein
MAILMSLVVHSIASPTCKTTRTIYGSDFTPCGSHCDDSCVCQCSNNLTYLTENGWIEFATSMAQNGTNGFLYGEKPGDPRCPGCYYAGVAWRWNYCKLDSIPNHEHDLTDAT